MSRTAPPIPRVELAQAPTPLLHLERVSKELGVELWVKRDDLTGLLESGNKVRKLEFFVGEALAQGADTLITCGRLQSNCCRTVAAVAARLGLRASLVLEGSAPAEYDGNLLLDRLLGADIRFASEADWERIDQIVDEIAATVRAAGGTPYVIPEGGATVTGALGYVTCGQELAQQAKHGGPDFDTVVITAVSGSSHAGLLMARQLTGLRAEIVSVPVAREAAAVRAHVTSLVEEARRRYGLDVEPPAAVRLLDGYQAAGRGEVGHEELETVARLARQEGLLLDPVYTAKAFRALLEVLRRDPKALGPRICFVHTGGVFSVFPFRASLARVLDGPGVKS